MTRPRLSIVHPSDPTRPGPGGFDSFLEGFIAAAPADWDIEFIGASAYLPAGTHRVEARGRALELQVAFPGGNARLPLSLRFALACRKQKIRPRGSIVHFHRFESLYAVPDTGARRVCFLHNHPPELARRQSDAAWRWLGRLYPAALHRALRHCDALWGVDPRTPAWLADLGGMPECGIARVWIEPEMFRPDPPEGRHTERGRTRSHWGVPQASTVVCFAGRFDRQKNLPLLLDAFTQLLGLRPDAHLVLAGGGPLEKSLRRRARRLSIADRVIFIGTPDRAGVARAFRAADVSVCSSWYESGPRTTFESLACGTPVVSLPVGQALTLPAAANALRFVQDATPTGLATVMDSMVAAPVDEARIRECANAVAHARLEPALAPIIEQQNRWLATPDRAPGKQAA